MKYLVTMWIGRDRDKDGRLREYWHTGTRDSLLAHLIKNFNIQDSYLFEDEGITSFEKFMQEYDSNYDVSDYTDAICEIYENGTKIFDLGLDLGGLDD